MQRKKLPIGIQTFREIREEAYYYVDKTPFALQLIDQGKALQQLIDKGYAEKYREPGVSITLVGIEFGREARNIIAFDYLEV